MRVSVSGRREVTSSTNSNSQQLEDASGAIKKQWPIHPIKDELCTLQLRRFLKLHETAWDFFYFVVHLADRADQVRLRATKALAAGGDEKYANDLKQIEADPQPAQDKLNSFGNYQAENMVIRMVDNFLSYLAEIIQQAIQKQPRILMSEEMIRVEDILRFTRYSELVSYLVEKKISSLSYSSIKDIERFVQKRTGLELFSNDLERTLLVLSIELRNIYSHNRGIVSEMTLRKLAGLDHGWDLKKGKRWGTDYDELTRLSNNLVAISRRLDASFAIKFGIKRKRYDTFEKKFAANMETHLDAVRGFKKGERPLNTLKASQNE